MRSGYKEGYKKASMHEDTGGQFDTKKAPKLGAF